MKGQREPVRASSPASAAILYCGLAYAFTWLAVLPLVASATGRAGLEVPDWWHVFGAIGPLSAAAVLAWRSRGRARSSAWLQSLTRVDIGSGWWAVALGTPLVLAAGAVGLTRVLTGEWQSGALPGQTDPGIWPVILLVSVAYGLGEEPGWRGFLLPRLMELLSPRAATVVLAMAWAGWHAPFFAYRYEFAGLMTVVGFFISMLAGAFWLTFLYTRTHGSVPAVAAWHVVWNLVSLGLPEASALVIATMNVGMMVLGFGVIPFLKAEPPG